MMNTERAIDYAQEQMERGDLDGAIATLVELLGHDADHAEGHALLALVLVPRKRLHAALLEARLALELEPDLLAGHVAMANVSLARRDFASARTHLREAAQLAPESAWVETQWVRLSMATDAFDDALAHAQRANELQPSDAHVLSWLALVHLRRGERQAAAERASEALEIDPEDVQSLVVLGHCELAAGNVDGAREAGAWALQLDPMNEAALTLFGAIKARRSFALGLWWRFQAFVSSGSNRRAIAILIGLYVVYRIGFITLTDHDEAQWAIGLQFAWIGFAVYTWVAPAMFMRSIRRETQQVSLRPDF